MTVGRLEVDMVTLVDMFPAPSRLKNLSLLRFATNFSVFALREPNDVHHVHPEEERIRSSMG